jgi:hypothetical protein
MSYVATQGKFHVALDGVGLLLQGAPAAPAYQMKNAPVYGTRFASGDRDYNDLSQWWYLIQTDWSAGIKDTISFVDDAKYYYSSNIDASSQSGSIKLSRAQTDINTFTENVKAIKESYLSGFVRIFYGTDVNGTSGLPVVYMYDGATYTDITTASLFTGHTQVAFFEDNGEQMFVGMTGYTAGGGGNSWAVFTSSNNGTLVRQSSNIAGVMAYTPRSARAGVYIDGIMYIFAGGSGSFDNRCSIVKTAVKSPTVAGDYSLVSVINPIGYVLTATGFQGNLYYLQYVNSTIDFRQYDLSSNTDTSIFTFDGVDLGSTGEYGCFSGLLKVLNGEIIITIPSKDVWTYDGSNVTRIYNKDTFKSTDINSVVAVANLTNGAIIAESKAWWGNLMYDGTAVFNTEKPASDTDTDTNSMFESLSTGTRYMIGSENTKAVKAISPTGTTYKSGASGNAFLVLNQYDKLQSIDKLLNTVTIGFSRFASGQSIDVYYTMEPTPAISLSGWTLLGTASYAVDGGTVTSKELPFPVGTTAKKIWFRINLSSTSATTTPALSDFTLEYLPMPNYKKEWEIRINGADEVKRLDGRLVETTGRELKSRLERMWWNKSALDFQDLDYATTTLNGAISDATSTTITVNSTKDFPEQGRFRVDDEEFLYTNKTPTTFTGCTRGARGTRATTHTTSTVAHNAYRVLVMGISEQVPILLEDKSVEYVVGLSLREV